MKDVKLLIRFPNLIRPLAFIIAAMVVPVTTLDDQIVLRTLPQPNTYNAVIPGPGLPLRSTGTLIFMVAGLVSTMTTNLLGPLMGISSVLWFIMRNDAAIKPKLSWTVFGIWSMVTLMYLFCQSRRVAHGNYMYY